MAISPELWKEIEELYNAAVDLDSGGRSVLLSRAKPELREIVSDMLSRDARERFLDRPVWEGETETQIQPQGTPRSSFGHYRVDEAVGAGGMGEVFLSWDPRLGRKVAIKSIRPGYAGLEARLWEEARAASALNHPNIVTIYDIGTVDGQPYLVMEWVEGETLRHMLNRRSLEMAEVVGIAAQIAEALQAAHEAGILHRDLKPENVMVTAAARVKVLDFGIAKRVARSDAKMPDGAQLTIPGAVIGTPGYMSPEQARGEELDFRSDHFCFGALVYEMASGKRAFPGKTAAEVQGAILFQQPEPLGRLNPGMPASLVRVVERCLAKSRADRFASAAELLRELSAVAPRGVEKATPTPAVFAIPAPRTALIGREDEIARLKELLADPDLRVLTLTGAGGIGKTRLAFELVRQCAGGFPGGGGVVLLEKIAQPGLVPYEVMSALGVPQSQQADPGQAIADHFERNHRGSALLLLDNFEHVVAAADFVASLPQDRLKIVITSRAPLRIYGEYEFPVPPLLSSQSASDAAIITPAVQLFLDRAPGLRGSARDREQLRMISTICERLDGLPLAIELAAARTKVLPLKSLLERVSEPLAVLVGGARDLPRRQQTLQATLDWSYNLLDSEHQKLFRRMAVFVGGGTIDAVESVCDTRQDLQVNLWAALEHLVDNSLIRRISADDEEPRFAMLETMREYGVNRLMETGEDRYTRKAHAAYCLVLAEEQKPTTRRERTGNHRFDQDLGNFRAALEWLISAGEAEWGLRLILALWEYFFTMRLHKEGMEYTGRLLALPALEKFPRLRNWGNCVYADFAHDSLGETIGNEHYLVALKGFEEVNDREGMAQVAHRLAYNLRFSDLPEARKWAEQFVEIARTGFPPLMLAGALSNLADVVQMGGEYALARSLHVESTRIFDQCGSRENAIWGLSHQADVYRAEGQDAQARSMYLDALDKFREIGNSHGVASCLHDLAGLHAAGGNLEQARALYQQCLRLYGPRNVSDLPRVLESLAGVMIKGGDGRRALTLAGAAAAMRERFNLRARFAQPSEARRYAEIHAQIESARIEAGAEAADLWTKGWNMSEEEIVDRATED